MALLEGRRWWTSVGARLAVIGAGRAGDGSVRDSRQPSALPQAGLGRLLASSMMCMLVDSESSRRAMRSGTEVKAREAFLGCDSSANPPWRVSSEKWRRIRFSIRNKLKYASL